MKSFDEKIESRANSTNKPEKTNMKYIKEEINAMHSEMVRRLAKPGEDIIAELSPESAHLWHMGTGVSGEAGELLDAIKKHVIYGKPLDYENVVEELGDLEFYMKGIRQVLGLDREEILLANINKLDKRYSDGSYSDQCARDRADKDL